MSELIEQCSRILLPQIRNFLTKDLVTIGAPAAGTGIGFFYSFLDKAIPVLTFVSLITGIILGILSYRLKARELHKQKEDETED